MGSRRSILVTCWFWYLVWRSNGFILKAHLVNLLNVPVDISIKALNGRQHKDIHLASKAGYDFIYYVGDKGAQESLPCIILVKNMITGKVISQLINLPLTQRDLKITILDGWLDIQTEEPKSY